MDDLKNNFPLTVLAVIDGWGLASPGENNAVSRAKTPFLDAMIVNYPATSLGRPKKAPVSREQAYRILGALRHPAALSGAGCVAAVLGEAGIKQLRIGESENIACLSDFFDQGALKAGKDYKVRIVPSAAGGPGKSRTKKIGSEAIRAVKKGEYRFIALSFAGIDLACREKDIGLVIEETEAIDSCLESVRSAVFGNKGQMIILGSFGRVEDIGALERGGNAGISANPVPLIIVAERFLGKNFNWPDPSGADLSPVKPAGRTSDFAASFLSFVQNGSQEFVIKNEYGKIR